MALDREQYFPWGLEFPRWTFAMSITRSSGFSIFEPVETVYIKLPLLDKYDIEEINDYGLDK